MVVEFSVIANGGIMPRLYSFIPFLFVYFLASPWGFSHALAQNTEFDPYGEEQQLAEDHLRLGIDFYLVDDLNSAIQEFQEAQQHWAGYANAHWNMGVGLAKVGDLEGGVSAWAQAERLDPSVIPVHYTVSALIAYNYGIGLLQQGALSKAITEWEHALELQHDFAEVHYALGLAYRLQGNTLVSQHHFEQAVAWSPTWPEAIHQLGMASYHNGEHDTALYYLSQAVQLNPNAAQTHSNLGLVHFDLGNRAEAGRSFHTAITIDPELPQAHFNLALLHVTTNDWAKAVDHLHTTIRLKPQFPDAHAVLGSALSFLGNWAQARQHWHIALALHPMAPYAGELHYNIGMAYRLTNDYSKAIHSFQQALQHTPSSAHTHFQLGAALEAAEKWGNAGDHYLMAIQLNPQWALPYYKLGLIRYNQGLLDAAIESFRRSIALHPDNPEAQYQLGVTLRAANQPEQSLNHIRAAAQQGVMAAQEMLGTMYANGSGTQRDLVQAMRWWFRAAFSSAYGNGSKTAQAHLARLRTWAYSHQGNPDYIQQILNGFQAIRNDIHAQFNLSTPISATEKSVGITLVQSGQHDRAIPILLQEALALNSEAHDHLQEIFHQQRLRRYHPRILDFFQQTAQEGSLESCRFLKTLADQTEPVSISLGQQYSEACKL